MRFVDDNQINSGCRCLPDAPRERLDAGNLDCAIGICWPSGGDHAGRDAEARQFLDSLAHELAPVYEDQRPAPLGRHAGADVAEHDCLAAAGRQLEDDTPVAAHGVAQASYGFGLIVS